MTSGKDLIAEIKKEDGEYLMQLMNKEISREYFLSKLPQEGQYILGKNALDIFTKIFSFILINVEKKVDEYTVDLSCLKNAVWILEFSSRCDLMQKLKKKSIFKKRDYWSKIPRYMFEERPTKKYRKNVNFAKYVDLV